MNGIVLQAERCSKKFLIFKDKFTVAGALKSFLRKKPLWRELWALREVCFSVKKGERLAVIGRAGSGKTTLIRIASGIYSPTSGRIRASQMPRALLKMSTGLSGVLTLEDNAYLYGALHGIPREVLRRDLPEILEYAGVPGQRFSALKDLSDGQRQRFALAVFLRAPGDFFMFDEGLAFANRGGLEAYLKQLDRFLLDGKTLLMASHNISLLRRYCTSALWLEDGRVRMCGEAGQVFDAYEESLGETSIRRRTHALRIAGRLDGPGGNVCTAARPVFRCPKRIFTDDSAPRLIVHGCHHRGGTVWFRNALRAVAETFGMEFHYGRQEDLKFGAGIFLEDHSRIDARKLPPFRGTHIIRDPRDTVVSGYFYHLWAKEPWLHVPMKQPPFLTYQAYLNSLSREEGILAEMRRFARSELSSLTGWDYARPDFLEVRYEDMVRDEREGFARVFRHYGFGEEAAGFALEIAETFRFEKVTGRSRGEAAEGTHLRCGLAGQWKEHFTPEHKKVFKRLAGEALIRLGYETGMDW